MTTFTFITHKQNFLPRPCADEEAWELNSDLVARVTWSTASGPLDVRLVVPAGSYRCRRLPRPARARAEALRTRIYTLPASPRTKDDLFIMALHADGYPHLRRETLFRRARGYLRHLWKYGKIGGL